MIDLKDMEANIRWYAKHQFDDDEMSIIPSMLMDMREMLDELRVFQAAEARRIVYENMYDSHSIWNGDQ